MAESPQTAPVAQPSTPDDEQAFQFCTMLAAGLPASEAILYFIDSDDPGYVAETLRRWQRSRAVKRATARLQSTPWTEMGQDEALQYALDHHYRTLAYILLSRHYAEVGQLDKAKLDSARAAIEAKLAGTAGKGDALAQFMDDLRTGKVKLSTPLSQVPKPLN